MGVCALLAQDEIGALRNLRWWAALEPICGPLLAEADFFTDPVPAEVNRHAVAHAVDSIRYTAGDTVCRMLLIGTSLLCEVHQRQQSGRHRNLFSPKPAKD